MISVLTSKIYSICVNMIALFGLTNSTVNSLVSHPEAYFMFLTNDILSFKAYLFLYTSAISKQTHFSGLLRSSVVTGLLFIGEISALVRTEPSRFLITTERYASCHSNDPNMQAVTRLPANLFTGFKDK
ncbi:hypothetical protein VCUG_00085 [Vavraia culicis subsp. floridensis]|uniref:Uncharacterized protein n=1 Tax=Vavraia culicis (isolate floridensis) TaxID=948595 RepID=L2GXS8_VAVCU|nr:uncharacterized protein VCUG_00085 [Vavraia culicis subsp. floridensis]ELA48476.1 hypothetical protein VCUG_00085 [Vavraia culicis subsp. floridensis]